MSTRWRLRFRRRALGGSCHPVVALAGNPNTGKTTLFNRLTGMRQHTGNWPGKTVLRTEGVCLSPFGAFRIIDLPGTYTLLAATAEERVARDFICFGKPDATIVMADATALERNLTLVLQVMEITDRIVVCVNLIDEAQRKGVAVDTAALQESLGVPVVATSARNGIGVTELMRAVRRVADGVLKLRPRQVTYGEPVEQAVGDVMRMMDPMLAGHVNSRWLALRLLEKDQSVLEALQEYLTERDMPKDALLDGILAVTGR
ncbi:MAG: FeoB small GTPase domain-containing protein [Limnochordia bacterium]|jgi:ferrous iron transport protein B